MLAIAEGPDRHGNWQRLDLGRSILSPTTANEEEEERKRAHGHSRFASSVLPVFDNCDL